MPTTVRPGGLRGLRGLPCVKDLVVFVDDSAACAERVAIAAMLARPSRAHLTGVHVAPSMLLYSDLELAAARILMEAYEQQLATVEEAALRHFREAMRREDVPYDGRAVRGSVSATAAEHARFADLAIIGQVAPDRA
jgi:hypothetical protein